MTGDRTTGLTAADITRAMADLCDDNPAERTDYDLRHALEGWHDATSIHLAGPHLVVAHLTATTETGTGELPLSNLQTDRLTQLLNIDTALITAHTAATQED